MLLQPVASDGAYPARRHFLKVGTPVLAEEDVETGREQRSGNNACSNGLYQIRHGRRRPKSLAGAMLPGISEGTSHPSQAVPEERLGPLACTP